MHAGKDIMLQTYGWYSGYVKALSKEGSGPLTQLDRGVLEELATVLQQLDTRARAIGKE